MIKIIRNPNFTQWWNILVDGKLVDNARSHARALQVARKLAKPNQHILSHK